MPWDPVKFEGLDRLQHIEKYVGNSSRGWINPVSDFGAKGDDVTDDTAAIQAALNAVKPSGTADSGGIVVVPPGSYKITSKLIPKPNTMILGAGMPNVSAGAGGVCRFNGSTLADWIIDGTLVVGLQIQGMTFHGNAASGGKGVNMRGFLPTIRDCFFDNFGDQALVGSDVPGSGHYSNIFIQNSCLVRTGRAAPIGCFELYGSDAFCENVQVTPSYAGAAGSSVTAQIKGIAVFGSNHVLSHCIGHLGEEGIYVDWGASYNKFIGCRSDVNLQTGFNISGTFNTFDACHSYRDGQNADATYNAFVIQNTGNTFVGCRADALNTDARRCLYAFADFTNASSNEYAANTTDNLRGAVPYALTNTQNIAWPQTIQSPAFAASFTPNPALGQIIKVGALTGNITINAVAVRTTGQPMTFLFQQDATGGRTVAWDAAYDVSWSDTGNTASKRAMVSFVYDGATWRQIGAQRVWA